MEENKNQNNEVKNEENNKPKKKVNVLFLIIVLFVVVFLSVNVYATTAGYDNIFFMIKNMFAPDVEQSGDELLSDREIIISYKSIEIMDGVKVQINKLTIENEKATLHVAVNDEVYYTVPANEVNEIAESQSVAKKITPFKYQVFDASEKLICEQESCSETSGKYTELLELKDVTVDTKLLILKIFTVDEEKIAEIEIDLDTKELRLTGVTDQYEKISEIELKEFLGNVVRFNFFKDKGSITEYHTEEEYRNEVKVLYALELLDKKEASEEDVYTVLEELFDTKIIEPYSLANVVVTKGNGTFKYIAPKTEHSVHAVCLDITNLTYLDGIYTAECVYIYPTKADYDNEEIENLPQYKATVKIKTNELNNYTKFSVLNPDEMQITDEEENVGGDGEGYNEYNMPINISIKNYNVPSQYIEGVKYTMSNARVTEEFISEDSDTGFNLISIPGTTQEYTMNLNYQDNDYKVVFKVEYDKNNNVNNLWIVEDNDKIVGWLETAYNGTVVNLEILMSVSGVAGWKQTIVPGLQISHPVDWNIATINEEVEGLGTAIREFSCEPDNVSLTMKIYDGEIKVEKLEVVADEYCKLNPNAKRSEYVLDTRDKGGFLWIVACEENGNTVTEYYFGKSVGFSDNENKAVFQVVEVEYQNYEEADRVQLRVDLLSNMISKSR